MKGLESMNILIMGSFFVVALLAFLAALWLAYVENQEMLAKAKISMPDSSAVPTTPALTVPVSITTEKHTQEQLAVTPTTYVTKPFQPVVSSGQLYEMTLELHSLRIQANEINERLLALVSLVENLQETSSSTIREPLAV